MAKNTKSKERGGLRIQNRSHRPIRFKPDRYGKEGKGKSGNWKTDPDGQDSLCLIDIYDVVFLGLTHEEMALNYASDLGSTRLGRYHFLKAIVPLWFSKYRRRTGKRLTSHIISSRRYNMYYENISKGLEKSTEHPTRHKVLNSVMLEILDVLSRRIEYLRDACMIERERNGWDEEEKED